MEKKGGETDGNGRTTIASLTELFFRFHTFVNEPECMLSPSSISFHVHISETHDMSRDVSKATVIVSI